MTTALNANVALLSLAVLCAGCDDSGDTRADAPATSSGRANGQRWMQIDNKLTPAQWLASEGAAEPKSVADPAVRRIAANLETANRIYRESERMIANRAVQLEQMLREIGIEEPAAHILDDLTHVAGGTGQTEGFGAVSQHYYNLRANRMAREQALAELRQRYGRRS